MGSGTGRRTQFAMAFVPWIEEWQRMELSGTQTRVMLMMASRMEPSPFRAMYRRAFSSAGIFSA